MFKDKSQSLSELLSQDQIFPNPGTAAELSVHIEPKFSHKFCTNTYKHGLCLLGGGFWQLGAPNPISPKPGFGSEYSLSNPCVSEFPGLGRCFYFGESSGLCLVRAVPVPGAAGNTHNIQNSWNSAFFNSSTTRGSC